MHTSKLFWNAELKQLEVEVTNKKKVIKRWVCPEDQLAPDVPRTVSESEGLEVDFERDPLGNIIKVRLKGGSWSGPERTTKIDYDAVRRQEIVNAGHNDRKRDFRPNRQQPNNQLDQAFRGEFHNPYNFVPTKPRTSSDPELADARPAGHDRFLPKMLSGKLTVNMRVETPLLLPDTSNVEVSNDHKTFPVKLGLDGKPSVNPTAVRGMLRAAYEAVTNSRLSVFKKHTERLAFRMESTEGARSVPARIENGKIVLYTGMSEIDPTGKPLNEETGSNTNPLLCAAWLPSSVKISENGRPPRDAMHNEEVHAWLEKIQHINKKGVKDFRYWRVRKLSLDSASLGPRPQESRASMGEFIKVQGFICLTGQNIRNKHDERLFFVNPNPGAATIQIDFEPSTHGRSLEDLVKNYRKEHSEKSGELSSPPTPLVWSRHIRQTEFAEIQDDGVLVRESIENSPLCYVRAEKKHGRWVVDELYPVSISRRLHEVPPQDLLDPSLRPATQIQDLSPADRVFGWVGDRVAKDGSYRGQLRVGSVHCKTEADKAVETFPGLGLPLNILGQPKPQQGRFYVGDNDGKAQPRSKELTNENAGYRVGKSLRGRKVYPHHSNLPSDYWNNPTSITLSTQNPKVFKEYRRPAKNGNEQRDRQNRSIRGWVPAGTEFSFDLHFTNLSEVELGALVWVLSMNQPGDEGYFHRLGGGKPLGFGSVRLDLQDPTEITTGEDLIKFYSSLSSEREKSKTSSECKSSFEKVADSRILKCFKIACKGPSTGLPTRYPRARRFKKFSDGPQVWLDTNERVVPNRPQFVEPHADGLAYEWFVENNKDRNRYVLPKIDDDGGLPIFDHKK